MDMDRIVNNVAKKYAKWHNINKYMNEEEINTWLKSLLDDFVEKKINKIIKDKNDQLIDLKVLFDHFEEDLQAGTNFISNEELKNKIIEQIKKIKKCKKNLELVKSSYNDIELDMKYLLIELRNLSKAKQIN